MTGRLIDADKLEPHEQLEGMGNGMYEYKEEMRICGDDFLYCDGNCIYCPRAIPTYSTSSTETVVRAEQRKEE